MGKKKKKRADEMTTEEAMKRLFPKKVIKKVKEVMEEKHRGKPPKVNRGKPPKVKYRPW